MPAKRLDALLAIANLLAPNSKRVAAEVTQAFEKPAAYAKAHREGLADRSIDEPGAGLPWIALIDALVTKRALAEIDWKTDGVDIAGSLERLGVPKKSVAWLRKIDEVHDDRSTLELLEEAGRKLLTSDRLQLASLDMSSDNYCLVVVPAEQAKTLVALAKSARYGDADLFTGKGLAAAKRERIARNKRQRKDAERAAKRQAKQAEKWRFFARGKETWSFIQHERAIDTGYEAPKKKFYANHAFEDRNATKAAAPRIIDGWKAEGFREIDRDEYMKLAIAEGAYIGWVGPFPKDGHYWLENKNIVRALALDGDAICRTGGSVRKNFAELRWITHFETPEVAARELQAQIAQYNATSYKPIGRDALLKLYKK